MFFVVNSDSMGEGNDPLGKVLIGAFLKKLWARPEKPSTVIFYNSGVLLLDKQAGFMDVLVGLEEAGVELLACGTCLDDYKMRDKIVAGRVSSMEEIVNLMMSDEKVVTI